MRRVVLVLVVLFLSGVVTRPAWAGEYKQLDGTTIIGEVAAFDENGVVFRLRTGGFSPRYSWGRFTQEALKALAEDSRVKPFAEPFIDIPPEARQRPKPKPVILKDVPRVERPPGRTTFFSSFTAPMGLLILALLYAANLYAAYEVALYRNRPVAVVCGLSALLPLLGPLVFLASPTLEAQVAEEVAAPEVPGPGVPGAATARGTTSRALGAGMAAPAAGTALRVAAAEAKAAPAGQRADGKLYTRGETTFNRRFIETQFSGFFRIVPSEAEKDLVLVIKTAKQEYIVRRITRISSNEMFVQPIQTGAKEVNIGFGEIAQMQVRHKDSVG